MGGHNARMGCQDTGLGGAQCKDGGHNARMGGRGAQRRDGGHDAGPERGHKAGGAHRDGGTQGWGTTKGWGGGTRRAELPPTLQRCRARLGRTPTRPPTSSTAHLHRQQRRPPSKKRHERRAAGAPPAPSNPGAQLCLLCHPHPLPAAARSPTAAARGRPPPAENGPLWGFGPPKAKPPPPVSVEPSQQRPPARSAQPCWGCCAQL